MRYNVDTLTLEDLQRLIALGDDSHANQIRINYAREIYLSPLVGAQPLYGYSALERASTVICGHLVTSLQPFLLSLYRITKEGCRHMPAAFGLVTPLGESGYFGPGGQAPGKEG